MDRLAGVMLIGLALAAQPGCGSGPLGGVADGLLYFADEECAGCYVESYVTEEYYYPPESDYWLADSYYPDGQVYIEEEWSYEEGWYYGPYEDQWYYYYDDYPDEPYDDEYWDDWEQEWDDVWEEQVWEDDAWDDWPDDPWP